MELTTDPRDLYSDLDATDLNDDTFEFNISKDVSSPDDVDLSTTNSDSVIVTLESLTESVARQRALNELQDVAETQSADEQLENPNDYDTLFLDRANQTTYLVDTSRFGYHVIGSDGEGFVAIYPEIAQKIE